MGETVTLTIGGISQTVKLGGNGSFLITFSTSKLTRGSYTVTYSYRGDANFMAATNASTTLTIS